jgi:hypothetical protein
MSLYQIVGLTKTSVVGHSYLTRGSYDILHDETGKGITIEKEFTKYILYILLENTYYAIHLYQYDFASFYGKLSNMGTMQILPCNYTDELSNITHVPIKPLFVIADFEIKNYNHDDDMFIVLHEEPDIYVFQYSSIGGDEKHPVGYVCVNMDLFQPAV